MTFFLVGPARLELTASWSQTKRSSQTELHPEYAAELLPSLIQKLN